MPRPHPGSRRGAICVALGFAFLLNPLVVGTFDIGDPDTYVYESGEITFHDNGTVDRPAGVDRVDPAIACLESFLPRSCVLERAIYADGGIRYDVRSSDFRNDYRYVHVNGEGFFEPIVEDLGNGTFEYTHRPVPRGEVLDDVSEPSSEVSSGVRTAIETGEYRTSDPLADADELVVHDGSYYVVSAVSYPWEPSDRRDVVVVLQWVVGIAGAWLVLRGQRLRVIDTETG